MEYFDPKTAYTILHLIGMALGAGGAFVSDGIFVSTIEDERITKTEIRFISLGGRMVWVGLALLVVSGALLFSLDPAGYMASSKFLVKMTIVGIIAINGVFIHRVLKPCIEEHEGVLLSESSLFTLHTPKLLLGGVVSMTSWLAAIVLGALRGIPYTYAQGMLFYVLVILFGLTVALLFHRTLLEALWKNN